MKLVDLLAGFPDISLQQDWRETEISALCHDSRSVEMGCLFFAIAGTISDGRRYIEEVVAKGAAAIVADNSAYEFPILPKSFPLILVDSARQVESVAAEVFFGVTQKLDWRIAITGTNGKTSVAWLTSHALAQELGQASCVGTLGLHLLGQDGQSNLSVACNTTTPDPIARSAFLRDAQKMGNRALSMEVSSHALDQGRAAGIDWDVAVFTNLSRDHLDYHETLERYAEAKKHLFFHELLLSKSNKRSACINAEDPLGRAIIERLQNEHPEIAIVDYGASAHAVKIVDANFSMHGTSVRLDCAGIEVRVDSPLVGAFNAENIAAATATLIACGLAPDRVAQLIELCPCVPGRLERVGQGDVGVFVDYAHTPDALQKAQQALKELCRGRLITVFGCGGDRDRGKRPEMGHEVSCLSDFAIVTTDNPRSEDPEQIIKDILPGLGGGSLRSYKIEVDRRMAIRKALEIAEHDDIVLVAGKGHEDYQEIEGIKYPFSDVEECLALLK